jgi:hypothetical protein
VLNRGVICRLTVADADIDDPVPETAGPLSSSGAPLTEEQRRAKVEELRKKIAARKIEKAALEKVMRCRRRRSARWVMNRGSPLVVVVLQEEERTREIRRREDGQKMIETQRELAEMQRKREMEKRKKVRLGDGLGATSREVSSLCPRRCNSPFAVMCAGEGRRSPRASALAEGDREGQGGTASSVCAVHAGCGVVPEIALWTWLRVLRAACCASLGLAPEPAAAAAAPTAAPVASPEEVLSRALHTLSQYTVGGEGLRALNTLRAYVNNALQVRRRAFASAPRGGVWVCDDSLVCRTRTRRSLLASTLPTRCARVV